MTFFAFAALILLLGDPEFDLPPLPGDSGKLGGGSADDLDFDDLTRRFEDLKRKK